MLAIARYNFHCCDRIQIFILYFDFRTDIYKNFSYLNALAYDDLGCLREILEKYLLRLFDKEIVKSYKHIRNTKTN